MAEVNYQQESDFDYWYIIIDEYQDISKSCFGLVKAIIDKTGAKEMCVGDDLQSIIGNEP
jgi:DNA helicase-4